MPLHHHADGIADEHGIHARRVRTLPLNLLDALRALEGAKALKAQLGAPFVDAYLKLKHADWMAYTRHLTAWERETTLDC